MTPDKNLGQLLRLGKAWPVVEARLEALMCVSKVEETPDLWPKMGPRNNLNLEFNTKGKFFNYLKYSKSVIFILKHKTTAWPFF
jgi:hypothetical protein